VDSCSCLVCIHADAGYFVQVDSCSCLVCINADLGYLYKWIHAVAWCVYMQIQAFLYKWIQAVAWLQRSYKKAFFATFMFTVAPQCSKNEVRRTSSVKCFLPFNFSCVAQVLSIIQLHEGVISLVDFQPLSGIHSIMIEKFVAQGEGLGGARSLLLL
jgi:hypothetical protein